MSKRRAEDEDAPHNKVTRLTARTPKVRALAEKLEESQETIDALDKKVKELELELDSLMVMNPSLDHYLFLKSTFQDNEGESRARAEAEKAALARAASQFQIEIWMLRNELARKETELKRKDRLLANTGASPKDGAGNSTGNSSKPSKNMDLQTSEDIAITTSRSNIREGKITNNVGVQTDAQTREKTNLATRTESVSVETDIQERLVKAGKERKLTLTFRYPDDNSGPMAMPEEAEPSPPTPGVDWIEAAQKYLKIDGNVEYNQFVQVWAATERNKTVTKHGITHRPVAVQRWMNTKGVKRFSSDNDPTIDGDFGTSFPALVWKWWFSIQPKKRGSPVGKSLPQYKGQWRTLDRWGEDGWVVLLAALKWWWLSIGKFESAKQVEAKSDWGTALQEMKDTFTAVASGSPVACP
ncbi:hypothetical protein E1B28_010752 [Marasmius oreades]|uniref:Uncharacterized protein n=1 Tax=Marasmius oreades TaxID=181124 RepID=A0A9P7UNU4_9AGAR|nr:uncharacterized protein E1B28_010752 [Marasmius oreades]KAG7089042.1 hypothetical protein E1B28_010752 [Marasmius oreades]